MPFREEGDWWTPCGGDYERGYRYADEPWTRVSESEMDAYFNAVSDPNCTEGEIRDLAREVAHARGWEVKP